MRSRVANATLRSLDRSKWQVRKQFQKPFIKEFDPAKGPASSCVKRARCALFALQGRHRPARPGDPVTAALSIVDTAFVPPMARGLLDAPLSRSMTLRKAVNIRFRRSSGARAIKCATIAGGAHAEPVIGPAGGRTRWLCAPFCNGPRVNPLLRHPLAGCSLLYGVGARGRHLMVFERG
jgi:hypothetical protein